MKAFLDEDFLLQNEPGRILFHQYAAKMPIFDYHDHLVPKQIAEDVKFANIARIWFDGDHYKWRLMRTLGVDERYITGAATDHEKYLAWAKALPYAIGNVLYAWTHMELKNPFGITGKPFGPDTAEEIWNDHRRAPAAGRVLRLQHHPADEREGDVHHRRPGRLPGPARAHPRAPLRVLHGAADLPARPRTGGRESRSLERVPGELEAAAGVPVDSFEAFVRALDKRHEFFHGMGARATDHAIVFPYAEEATADELEKIFRKLLKKEPLSQQEVLQFKTVRPGRGGPEINHRRGWVMQLHLAALRNTNTRQFKLHGPDSGYNSMDDRAVAAPLSRFLDLLDRSDELPRTCSSP